MCKENQCEYKPTLHRVVERSPDQEKYGQLWAEIILPKLLQEMKTHE